MKLKLRRVELKLRCVYLKLRCVELKLLHVELKLPAKATTNLSLSSELRFSKQGYWASLSLVLSFDLKLENLGTGMLVVYVSC